MNLDVMEKERLRAYHAYLKGQMEKQQKIKQDERKYKRKKQSMEMNEIIDRLDQDDVKRLKQRKNTALLLKEHNQEIKQLQKNQSALENSNQRLQNSFTDSISDGDLMRLTKLKNNLKDQSKNHELIKKQQKHQQNQHKQHQRQLQMKHVASINQWNDQSLHNYSNIIKKHEQNMGLFALQNELMRQNKEHQRKVENFTQTKKDILHHVWRDETEERKRAQIEREQLLKKQIDQFNKKKKVQEQHIKRGDDLDRSIFRSIHRKDQNQRQKYAEQLKAQIIEQDLRKSNEKKNMKEGTQIKGIFGGQHGRDRIHQIQYIDRKMGLSSSINLQSGKQKGIKPENLNKKQQKSTEGQNRTQRLQQRKSLGEQKQIFYEKATTQGNSPIKPPLIREGNGESHSGMKEQARKQRYFGTYDVIAGRHRFYQH